VGLGREVAVKVLGERATGDEGARQRFRREALVIGRLAHPNIVSALDVGVADAQLYLVMELLTGRSLDEVLERAGVLEVARVERLLRQVSHALGSAHQAGVVHRDVKPANLVLVEHGPDEHTKVVDFGIASEATTSRMTIAGMVLGTPNYAAPELIVGHRPTPAADVYALGCTVYELLAGQAPFDSDDLSQTLQGHLSRAPTPLTLLRPDVSPRLAQLVHDMLEKEPARRPPDGFAVLSRLEARPLTRPVATVPLLGVRLEGGDLALAAELLAQAGMSIGRMVTRSFLARAPTIEVAFGVAERLASKLRCGAVLHAGPLEPDDEALEGDAARDAFSVLRVTEPGQLFVTRAAYDALGVGFRARLELRRQRLVDRAPFGNVTLFELDTPRQGVVTVPALGVPDGSGVRFSCECGLDGHVPRLDHGRARVRCLQCSSLLDVSVSLDDTIASASTRSAFPVAALIEPLDAPSTDDGTILEGLSSLTGATK
jgi:serine/threonine-protein kinase